MRTRRDIRRGDSFEVGVRYDCVVVCGDLSPSVVDSRNVVGYCILYYSGLINSTQLNKPPRTVAHERKEAHVNHIPDTLNNSQVAF